LKNYCNQQIATVATIVILIASAGICTAKLYYHPPYKYHFNGSDDRIVSQLDEELRNIVPSIEYKLGVSLSGTVRIDLTLTKEEFNRITRGRVPRWAGGVASPQQNWIVVKAPLFFGQGVPLEVLTAHEISHLLMHKASGHNYIPRWFDEGLAQLLAGESRSGSLGRLSRAAASDRLIGLPRVDHVLSFSSQKAGLAYAEALSAADRFVDQFSWEVVRSILTGVRKGKEFENAFEDACGVSYEVWQVEWMDYARDRYRWWALMDMDNLIWMSVVMIGIFGMTVAYIRQRRQLKRLIEEEGDYSDESDPIQPS